MRAVLGTRDGSHAQARPSAFSGGALATPQAGQTTLLEAAGAVPRGVAGPPPSASRDTTSHRGDADAADPAGAPASGSVTATPRAVAAAPLGPGPRIIFDLREQQGSIVRHLHSLGAQLDGRQLDVGDFILSDRVAVERKSTADFVDSLVDGRLFGQLRNLRAYPRPFLVVEGESLHGHRNVSGEAIMGALASVLVDHGIPVIQVRDSLETARFLHAVAKREQGKDQRKMAVRPLKPAMSEAEHQVYLLAGLPGISDTLATRLLDRFGSVAAALAASTVELAEVEGVGPQKASEIRRILDLVWRPRRGA